jgi:hypothetical protein
MWYEGVGWIHVVQDTLQSRGPVQMANFGVYKGRGSSWSAERLLASQDGLWTMELVNTDLTYEYDVQ